MDNDRRALADTPKGQTIRDKLRETIENDCHFMPKDGSLGHVVIYDDTAAATPLDNPAGYDLDTCSQKHQRMMAYQARRIDQLQFDLETAAGEIVHLRALGSMTAARLARLEAILEDWSAGK